jgi:5'-3' exoribonuclease 2
MNQQRSRRFRAAQEAADKEEERRESIKLFEAMGHPVSDEAMNKKSWDTNAITPGTPFMDLLSKSLKYWISWKLTNDPGWKDVKVILSDSSVPGEGEHKIVDWIRRQRTDPGWDANTSHVIYGLVSCLVLFQECEANIQDADLIMLALATHEPNFRVLREDVFAQGSTGPRVCKKCGVEGHVVANCKGVSISLRKHLQLTLQAKPHQKTLTSSKRPNQSTQNHSSSSTSQSSENT